MPELTELVLPLHSPEGETRIYTRLPDASFVPGNKDVVELCRWPEDGQGRKDQVLTAFVDHRKLTLAGRALVYLEPFMIFAIKEQAEAAPFNPGRRDWCTEAWGDLEVMLTEAGWQLGPG